MFGLLFIFKCLVVHKLNAEISSFKNFMGTKAKAIAIDKLSLDSSSL